MRKKTIYFVIIGLLMFLFFVAVNVSYAGSGVGEGGQVKLPDPLDGTNPQVLIGKIIKAILGLVGSLALIMFIYGGILWMTAAGNAEQVTKGKNVLIWTTIGLVIIFTAYALVTFVFTAIGVS